MTSKAGKPRGSRAFRDKMIDEDIALSVVNRVRSDGFRSVLAMGAFDVMDAGQMHYLTEAARLGDRLLVAVYGDEQAAGMIKEGEHLETLARRMELVALFGSVDHVFPIHDPNIRRVLLRLKPDTVAVGVGERGGYDKIVKTFDGVVRECGEAAGGRAAGKPERAKGARERR